MAAGLLATGPLPALAQGVLKPVQAVIVNDTANPVPVSVVAAPSPTTVVCTGKLGGSGLGGPITTGIAAINNSGFVCSGGATSIDVSRIIYTPDLGNFVSEHIIAFRATVTHRNEESGFEPGDILAVLTDGAPDATVVRPFRFDSMASGRFVNVVTGSSGIQGFNAVISGTILLIGAPAQ
ncbi:hypothetical protein LuPra_03353 [Luteitalea pratensis]|uniref:Uncharacterized protein n=2 Tax=Luteitalea pratensis TaxID=1855912 RepID=A0A143PNE0_LUTPR|nr:hypothetical protein LuPra_03353 [Luteitalea pratensis]